MCASLEQHSISFYGVVTWIGILWKMASMLNKLAGDDECRLAPFHVIRNFLANEF